MKRRFEFPDLLQAFFTDRLMSQRQASAHTIASYRDTFRLLIEYVHQTLKKEPTTIRIADLNSDCVVSFLNHLEKNRGVSARSRNQRLGAIRSFFRYIAFKAPEHSGLVQQILAIPSKRYDHKLVGFLTREEIEAILQKPDRNTWIGRRDHALILVAVQTGMRVSELTGLCRRDLAVENAAHVRCLGKGRRGSLHSPHETNDRGSALVVARTARLSGNAVVPKFSRRTHEFRLLSILAR